MRKSSETAIGFESGFPPLPLMPADQAFAKFTFRHLLRIWKRHFWLFCLVAAAVLAIGLVAVQFLKPTYTATSVVAISILSNDPLASQNDSSPTPLMPGTNAAALQSRDVATAVLAQYPMPPDRRSNLKQFVCRHGLAFLCPASPPKTSQQKLDGEVDAFLHSVTVAPVPNSSVINISVTASSGQLAANWADAIVTNYQRIDLARQTANVNGVASWLDQRTQELRQSWTDAVDAANNYSVLHHLTASSNGASPNPLINSEISDVAQSLNAAQASLAASQAHEAALEKAIKHGDPNAVISQTEAPVLVAAEAALSQLQSSRAQLAQEFGSNNPQIKSLNAQIAAAQEQVSSQTATALNAIRTDADQNRTQVQALASNLEALRGEAANQTGPQAQYNNLLLEAGNKQQAYQSFVTQSNDVVERAALLEPPVTFYSHAEAPQKPTFPNKPKLRLGVFVMALAASFGAVLVRDHFSRGIGDLETLRAIAPWPLLAVLPWLGKINAREAAGYVLAEPFSPLSDTVRGLAAKLSLLAIDQIKPRTILISSAGTGEGKSVLTLWLAAVSRRGNKPVLVINGDSRQTSLMSGTEDLAKPGLTDLLAGRASIRDAIQADSTMQIDFIGSGPATPIPFGSDAVQQLRDLLETLKLTYSLILIDSPPLLSMTEGLVYGSVADQTLFICRWQETSRDAVTACVQRLQLYGARIAGTVVSMADQSSGEAFEGNYSRREMELIRGPYPVRS